MKNDYKNLKFLLTLDRSTSEKLDSILNDYKKINSNASKSSLITNLINEKY